MPPSKWVASYNSYIWQSARSPAGPVNDSLLCIGTRSVNNQTSFHFYRRRSSDLPHGTQDAASTDRHFYGSWGGGGRRIGCPTNFRVEARGRHDGPRNAQNGRCGSHRHTEEAVA